MMKFTGQSVYDNMPFGYKDPDAEEPDEAKVSSAQQSLWDVRFGSGGGVGDCPADHNLVANELTTIEILPLFLSRLLEPQP